MVKKLLIIAVLAGLLGQLPVCGQKELVFTPVWTAQAQFAGFYVADALGFYKEVGLNVVIRHPSASSTAVNRLRSGESHFACLQLVSALQMINEGDQLVNILQYSQQSGLMIVSHEPLKGFESLKGKRVGYFRSGISLLPIAISRKKQLDINWIPFISHANLYISGAFDATLVMSYNEYHQLKYAGQRLNDNQVLNLRNIGYNLPEDGLWVTRDFYEKHRSEVVKFAQATKKGWEWAVEHPKETLDIVMFYIRQNGIASNQSIQRWMLKDFLRLLVDPKTGKRTYRLDPQAFDLANRILLEGGIISQPITYQQITKP